MSFSAGGIFVLHPNPQSDMGHEFGRKTRTQDGGAIETKTALSRR